MPSSMELPLPTNIRPVSRSSFCPSFTLAFNGYLSYRTLFRRRWNCVSKPLRISLNLKKDSSVNEYQNTNSDAENVDFWLDSGSVEVIGIGSRKDAVLDFCLGSPFQSTSLRFWNVLKKDSLKVHLQQRLLGKDITPRIVEAPLSLQSCSKAIILVASAAYGLDHIATMDILRTIRTADGLTVALILKPFSFEGQRRQNEVRYLVSKLQEHTNFCIGSILLLCNYSQEKHKRCIDVPHNNMNSLTVSEVIEIMERYKSVKVGFGAGYNNRTSIAQAIYDCPFLGVSMKDLKGMVICVLASSGVINSSDVNAFLQTFRQTTDCTSEIVISTTQESNLKTNLIITTVFILSCTEQETSQNSIFATLADRYPFVLDILRRNDRGSNKILENVSHENPCLSKKINSPESSEIPNKTSVDGRPEDFDMCSKELEEIHTLLSSNSDEIHSFSDELEKSGIQLSEGRNEPSNIYDQDIEGAPSFQRETLIGWNVGPGHQIAKEWAKERTANPKTTPVVNNLSNFLLPVGVRPLEKLKDGSSTSNPGEQPKQTSEDDTKAKFLVTPSMSSWNTLTSAGFEAVMDFYFSTSASLKKKYTDVSKKQRSLYVRAASMLETERDSQKKWCPIVEMEYQGGVYRGHCQGGLPEGKGRLSVVDGSIYDGMWHYGKRSGLGTFYYCNGDVFQGSWRDDVIHGKGWFYFHTGDRWFSNFWKGKANGEGRFYSKSGDIFFGHFQDGWRHGHFLCINFDGVRFVEIWNRGVLVSRDQLDPNSSVGSCGHG
ncbi:protein ACCUMULATION AND REPLICATION OF CHLOROPLASTS 3, chloroplastic isoform X2 [Malania oleifera]|uniref:protein ACCUMULATION AND REPLICATION OF CHLOROPLASTS 3, chloroplastic isoform X2 n=1 Tax=Malania oleifera TaxID=397392 RepID=UPI0025ADB3C4|nr:protein ACCUMULATION AND REPLICATION OF CHLOROPLASTS 3, chloroplastic isoform X2 [Malania oleifera]XP_057962989.1 protein ACCUMULATION AND REPLICATION OF CHLOROPLASTS 3, chloroplastic isoform X2 [Malania oleifera]